MKTTKHPRTGAIIPEPEVGAEVYVPSSYYLSHGVDDFEGGLCRISRIRDTRKSKSSNALNINRLSVEVEERPGWFSNWYVLMEQQDELRERYGHRRGYQDPDLRPEFNEW